MASPGTVKTSRRIVRGLRWLLPGLRVKRWLLLVPVGLAPVILGVVVLAQLSTFDLLNDLERLVRDVAHVRLDSPLVFLPVGLALVGLGLLILLGALVAVNRSIVGVISPEHLTELPEVIRRKRHLAGGARIVVIGGGTGLSTLLRGLKHYSSNLTAVVTMTDDGGSSGLLQQQLPGGILPPGDIRNCLVALADEEGRMQDLFQYRFATRDGKDGLSGHSFGNLLIAALTDITGDFEKAIEATSDILAIRGRVLPSTTESVVLVGEMADGREITGESRIADDDAAIVRIKLCPENAIPLPQVLTAIRQADVIVLGPGSVFTSVVPNLLVTDLARAVQESRALRVYICNVMTQRGETDGFTASDHLKAIDDHVESVLPAGSKVVDCVLVNTARPSAETLERYARAGSEFVEPDVDKIESRGYKTVKGKFMSEKNYVRHDADALAAAIMKLWQKKRSN